YMKCSNQTHLSLHSISDVTYLLLHFISLKTGSGIGNEAAIKLAEALESHPALTSLNLSGNRLCFISFSLNTDNKIDDEGAIKLSEALKSNSTLSSLNLRCNRLVASFHSHTIQAIRLEMKELSKYLKHSNQTH